MFWLAFDWERLLEFTCQKVVEEQWRSQGRKCCSPQMATTFRRASHSIWLSKGAGELSCIQSLFVIHPFINFWFVNAWAIGSGWFCWEMRVACRASPTKSWIPSPYPTEALCRSLNWTWKTKANLFSIALLIRHARFWGNWMLLSTVTVTKVN